MSLIARQYNFVTGEKILVEELTGELDQLYRFLSGALSGQMSLKQNSANSVLILVNTESGFPILDLQRNGISKLQLLETQQFKSLVTDVAPVDVLSITKVTGLNAQYLDGYSSSDFVLINTKHTEYFIPFFFSDAQVTTLKLFSYIVPAGTNMSLIQVKFFGFGGGFNPDGQVVISLRKNGGVIQTATLQDSNNFQQVNTLTTSVAENDVISCTIDSVVDGGLTSALIRVKFKQDLNT